MSGQESGERRIVVGVDGSPSSRQALRWAVRQATLTRSVVDAVTAWHDPASYAGYAWLITDTCDADLAAKTLSEAVDGTVHAMPRPGQSWQAAGFEAIITFGLVLMVLNLANGPKLNGPFVPLATAAGPGRLTGESEAAGAVRTTVPRQE